MTVTAVIRIVTGSGTLRTLQGLTRGLQSAAAAERRIGVQQERAGRQAVATAANRARAARQSADAEKREADRLTAYWRQLAERSRAVRERDDAAKTKASERNAAREVKANEKSAAAQRRSQDRTSKAAQKTAADRAKADAKAAADKARADARAAQASVRAADRELQARLRNLDRLRREREKAEAAATQNAKREAAKRAQIEQQTSASRRKSASNTLRVAGGAVGGAMAGVLAGGVQAAGTARGVAGVESAEARVMRANAMMQKLITTAVDAGLSQAETDGMREKIMKAAKTAATMPDEILEGLEVSHDRFNSLRLFLGNIEQIALAAKASSTPMVDYVGMLGAAQTAYGLTSEQMKEASDILLAAASEGSIRPKDFAGIMGPAMGTHAMNTGQRDLAGLRQFVGLMQGVGGARPGDAEGAETRGTQFVQFLSKKQVLKDLQAKGIRVRGDDGKIEIGNVLDQIAKNKDLQNPTQLQAIFHDMQAREGLQALLQQRAKVLAGETGAVDFKKMRDVDANIGAAKTTEKLDRLESSGLMELQRQAIDMQNDTITHLKDYNAQILAVTKATNELEKHFGTLGLWAGSITTVLGGVAGGATLGKIAGWIGGGASAAGAGTAAGGGLLATLGTGVAAASTAALAGATAVGGGVGYLVGDAVNDYVSEKTGQSLSDRLADWFMSDEQRVSRARYERGAPAPAPSSRPNLASHPAPPVVPAYKPLPPTPGATDLYELQRHEVERFRDGERAPVAPQELSGKIKVEVGVDQSGRVQSVRATGKSRNPGVQISTSAGPLTAGGRGG